MDEDRTGTDEELETAVEVREDALVEDPKVVPMEGLVDDPGDIAEAPHLPQEGMQPRLQWASALPQFPASEQQSPKLDPKQVRPFPSPHLPSVEISAALSSSWDGQHRGRGKGIGAKAREAMP